MNLANKYIYIFLLIFALNISTYGATPKTFSSQDQDFFSNATHDSTMLSENGTLTLAPSTQKLDGIIEPNVWQIYAATDGAIYVATGGTKAKIYRMKKGETSFSLFAEAPATHFTSIIATDDGRIYAASSPNATIYSYDQNGQLLNEIKLDDLYVWDMKADKNNIIYIATGGDKARILTLNAENNISELISLDESHVMSLYYDEINDIFYAGTEGRGLLLKVSTDGNYDVIYDTGEGEVHAIIANNEGDVFFGTANRETSTIFSSLLGNNGNSSQGQQKAFRNSLYKANKDGAVERLFYLSQILVFGLAKDNNGNIYFATGDKANLYRVSEGGVLNYVAGFNDETITSFAATEDDIFFTAKTGSVYRMSKSYANEGSFISAALDTHFLSNFGTVEYYANTPQGTSIAIETRTGNTAKVGNKWSAFVPLGNDDRIQSPKARFIQYKIKFTTEDKAKTPILTSISFAYIPQNLPPEVYKPMLLTDYNQKKTSFDAYKKPDLKVGQSMLIWTARDANNDKLSYSVDYRMSGSENYKYFVRNTINNYFIFDANKLPSGIYDFRIIVSDHLDNGIGETKTNQIELLNAKYDVTAPFVQNIEFSRDEGEFRKVRFTVKDELSNLSAVRISTFHGRWRYLTPEDGILDSKVENFSVIVEDNEVSSITLQVVDMEGNEAYYSYIIDVAE